MSITDVSEEHAEFDRMITADAYQQKRNRKDHPYRLTAQYQSALEQLNKSDDLTQEVFIICGKAVRDTFISDVKRKGFEVEEDFHEGRKVDAEQDDGFLTSSIYYCTRCVEPTTKGFPFKRKAFCPRFRVYTKE